MSNASTDVTKILTEKLTLAREVAVLKPEVESLRAQVSTQKEVLAEKLALQRQLSTVQVELENAQRSLERSAAKQAKNHDRTEFEIQLDEVHKQLGDANKAHKKAQREIERLTAELETSINVPTSHDEEPGSLKAQLVELRKQLLQSNKDRRVAEQQVEEMEQQLASAPAAESKSKNDEKVGDLKAQIADLRKQLKSETIIRASLETEVKEIKAQVGQTKVGISAEDISLVKKELEALRKEHAAEKKERQKTQKALEKGQTVWEAEKSTLDDKIDAFRNKLRSTKEKLKDTEQQLKETKSAATQNKAASQKPARVNPKKRGASQMDDSMLGTPGDGPQVKRNKLAGAVISRVSAADKTSFSITPFLNRTSMSLAPESPAAPAEDPQKESSTPAMDEATNSPSIKASKKLAKSKPLKPASSSKHNARKSARPPTLEKVTEEPSMLSKASSPPPVIPVEEPIIEKVTVTKVPTATGDQPTLKLKAKSSKSRKSLMSFASFVEEAAPEKKKKRKLGGTSAPKTLFDEDDDDKLPSKPIPGRGIFAAKALSKTFSFGAKKTHLAPAMEVSQQFSPLKKDRRR
jgi:hypothetical protein